jgi:predicted dehydrogenase
VVRERADADGASQACDAEDAFTAWLDLEGGTSVAIDSSFVAPVNLAPRLVITGDEGVLECVGERRILLRRTDGTRDEHERPAADGDPHTEPMRRWAVVVRNAVEDGEWGADVPTFADGLACAKVLDALRAG